MPIERKLAAIMFTDIVGFTKIMGDDETTALSILENQQSLINPIIEEYKGTIIKKMGDGLLIEFPSTVGAVECAIQMQDSIKSYNMSDDNLEFHIRIGIHLGDIVILGDDILGDGVNIASRIEPLASPDGICITDAVYQSVKSKLKLDAKRIDEVDLKHIDDKYTIYKLPKQSDEIVDSKDDNEIHLTKIEINSIDNETHILKTFFKTFSILLFMTLLGVVVSVLIGFIETYISLGEFVFRFNSLNYLIEEKIYNIPKGLVFSIFIITLSFLCSKWTYKIQFKDIRNVGSILDTLILNYGYEIISQSKNRIKYLHLPKQYLFMNSFTKSKYHPKFLTEMNILRTEYDGNTIRMEGMFYHIIRLLGKLKKHHK